MQVILFPCRQPELFEDHSFTWERLSHDRKTMLKTFNLCRYKAERKGKPWCIALEELAVMREPDLWRCWYCSTPLADDENISLDRINNNDRRYILGNVVPCCYRHNMERGALFSLEEYWRRVHRSQLTKESPRFRELRFDTWLSFHSRGLYIEDGSLDDLLWKTYLDIEFDRPPPDPIGYMAQIVLGVNQNVPGRLPVRTNPVSSLDSLFA